MQNFDNPAPLSFAPNAQMTQWGAGTNNGNSDSVLLELMSRLAGYQYNPMAAQRDAQASFADQKAGGSGMGIGMVPPLGLFNSRNINLGGAADAFAFGDPSTFYNDSQGSPMVRVNGGQNPSLADARKFQDYYPQVQDQQDNPLMSFLKAIIRPSTGANN
jgi:hypothetical protein